MDYIKVVTTRRTRLGVEVVRVHYTADLKRDSEWARLERRRYSSQAAWDREQEIVHEAGGGELLFAEILNRHADKIIIRDPHFEIPPTWKRIAGLDHGKTNPTAALVVAIDYEWVEFIVCVNTTSRGLPRRSTCRICTAYPASLMPRNSRRSIDFPLHSSTSRRRLQINCRVV